MTTYKQIQLQELAQSEVYQLRYDSEGKLVLPVSDAADGDRLWELIASISIPGNFRP